MTAQELKDAIGANVRNRRKELGYSQRFVADEVGVTQSQIAQIELGNSSPSVELVVKLANCLKTEPQSFYAPRTFSSASA